MEAMSKIKAVIMDKTGTITKGDFTVQKIVGGDELSATGKSLTVSSSPPTPSPRA